MGDPVADAASFLDKQDPSWRKKTPKPGTGSASGAPASGSLQGLKAASAESVDNAAMDSLKRRFGVK